MIRRGDSQHVCPRPRLGEFPAWNHGNRTVSLLELILTECEPVGYNVDGQVLLIRSSHFLAVTTTMAVDTRLPPFT